MLVYVAAPFFNPEQLKIVQGIESACYSSGHNFYSPRIHSGSHELTPEQRKDYNAWRPVIDSNIEYIERCSVVLAVLEYAMPHDAKLIAALPVKDLNGRPYGWRTPNMDKAIELPDAGVLWECGYAYKCGKTTVGFHTKNLASSVNLMLSHTLAGFLTGWTALGNFLQVGHPTALGEFNWDALETFGGEVI